MLQRFVSTAPGPIPGFFDELEGIRKGLRIRMGRYPAEIAEGAEVYWEGGKGTYIGAVFHNCLGQLNRDH